ncbi:MAG: hypothetical protein J5I65_17875 [Aridibacter famidurans]|nr:hypothetical protein [Aridibacter famidurans]
MNVRPIVFPVILLFASLCAGQVVTSNEDCPAIVIAGPLVAVKDGDNAIFTALITGDFDSKKIGYEWSLDNGEIVSGQGTNEISVTVSGKPNVTVNVSGIDEVCNGTVSLAAPYGDVKPYAIFFDEFGKVKDKLLERRIAALVDALRRNPTTSAKIITYGAADAVRKRDAEIKDLAARASGSPDLARMVFANGGVEKDIRTRVWIVPPGVNADELN